MLQCTRWRLRQHARTPHSATPAQVVDMATGAIERALPGVSTITQSCSRGRAATQCGTLADQRARSPRQARPRFSLFPQDTEPVTALAVSPDSRTVVVASRSLACRVYDLTTGQLLRTWRPHKAPVADLAIDSSGG